MYVGFDLLNYAAILRPYCWHTNVYVCFNPYWIVSCNKWQRILYVCMCFTYFACASIWFSGENSPLCSI